MDLHWCLMLGLHDEIGFHLNSHQGYVKKVKIQQVGFSYEYFYLILFCGWSLKEFPEVY